MRAFALPYLLTDMCHRDGWSLAPDRLIAASDTERCRRSSQTLLHLRYALSLPIHQASCALAVSALLFEPCSGPDWRFAVIVWRRNSILDVARILGAARVDLPAAWPRDLFDQIVLIDLDATGQVISTRCIDTPDETACMPPCHGSAQSSVKGHTTVHEQGLDAGHTDEATGCDRSPVVATVVLQPVPFDEKAPAPH